MAKICIAKCLYLCTVQHVLIFGAGRSSLLLIEYLAQYCASTQLQLKVCDKDTGYARHHCKLQNPVDFIDLDIMDKEKLQTLLEDAKLVISLLPAALHIHIAELCAIHRKHLATASYISDEMKQLDEAARANGLVFLNECGLDPGIDHMSAMKMMDAIRDDGALITGFESYCGGLMADGSDGDNPWKYKFTWNPRNVVVAGQGAPAQYMEDNQLKLIPYHQLFKRVEPFNIGGYGTLEGYPNRDSLKYREVYNLNSVRDMIRGTLRKPGYCDAWQVLIDLGMTDDHTLLEFNAGTTLKTWLESYLPMSDGGIVDRLKNYTGCSNEAISRIEWLGLFGDEDLPVFKGTSAQILEELLKQKWKLEEDDRDLVVMLHRIKFVKDGQRCTRLATMVLEGDNNTHTAMAKTVGLPLAIGCMLILEGKIQGRGVLAPVTSEFYEPILAELETFGISFRESEED